MLKFGSPEPAAVDLQRQRISISRVQPSLPTQLMPEGIQTMILYCQRLPAIAKSSFANTYLNFLPQYFCIWLIISCPLCCWCHRDSASLYSKANFPETIGIEATTRRKAEPLHRTALQLQLVPRCGNKIHSTWGLFRIQLKATRPPHCISASDAALI